MEDQILKLTKFAGVRTNALTRAIDDNEMSNIVNFDLGDEGQLVKRTAFIQSNTSVLSGANNPIQIIGFFNTDVYQQFIAKDGTNLYTSPDAKVWTLMAGGPWNNVVCGVQYLDKFYMVRKVGTVIEWNGVTAAGIVNSPAGTFCKIFKDRLFVINAEGAGSVASRIYFSNATNLSSTGWPATNYVGVNEGDGDRLIAVEIISDYLLVFKMKAIWNLFVQGSDTTSWILRPFRADTGCVSQHSIVRREGVVFFCGVDGIYTTDGSDVKLISSPVGNYFVNLTVDVPTINAVSAFYWKNKYVVTFPAYSTQPLWSTWGNYTWGALSGTLWTATSNSTVYLVYHLKRKGWTRWSMGGLNASPHIFVTVNNLPLLAGVYAGERSHFGRVMKYGDVSYSEAGYNITASFETKDFDLDRPAEKKKGKWIAVDLAGSGSFDFISTIDLNTYKNKTVVVGVESEVRIPGPGYFRIWRFYMTSTGANPLSVFGVSMYVSAKEYRPIKKLAI